MNRVLRYEIYIFQNPDTQIYSINMTLVVNAVSLNPIQRILVHIFGGYNSNTLNQNLI